MIVTPLTEALGIRVPIVQVRALARLSPASPSPPRSAVPSSSLI